MNNRYREAILSKKFGKLTPTKCLGIDPRRRRTVWECKCDCGNSHIVRSDSLLRGSVRSCGCLNALKGSQNKNWLGHGEISGSRFLRLKQDAKKRGFSFDISIRYIWDLFIKQNRKCALSGLELSFSKIKLGKDATASLDRIDSSKGYLKNNVQWIHKDINFMKQDFNQTDFIKYCDLISRFKANMV